MSTPRLSGACALCCLGQFVLPLVLLRLLKGLGDPGTSSVELYGVAVLMFVLTAFRVTIENHYFYHTFRLGAQVSNSAEERATTTLDLRGWRCGAWCGVSWAGL